MPARAPHVTEKGYINQLMAAEQQVRFQPIIMSGHTSELGFEKRLQSFITDLGI
jgi:hypothetical protein